jgi:hypothetical protein
MENVIKVGLLLLVGSLAACQTPSPYASYRGIPLTPLRADSALFTNADGRVFLRLPYHEIHQHVEHDPPYWFFDTLACGDQKYCAVAQWVDVPTFRRVPGTSNYWADKRALYTDPYLSLPGQQLFFELGLAGQVRFGADPDSAYSGRQGWYRGVPVGWR